MRTFYVKVKIEVDDKWLEKSTCPEIAIGNEVVSLLEKPHFVPDWDVDVELITKEK